MPYLDCPRCRARFHTGFIYAQLEVCPRCGAPFREPPTDRGGRLRRIFGRGPADEVPDWETITGSQYERGRVTRTDRRADG